MPAGRGGGIGISPATIDTYLKRIRRKLGPGNKAELTRRAATESAELGWDVVRRIIEEKDFWIFAVNRLKYVSLWKGALTPGQAAELTAFLAARRAGHAARVTGTVPAGAPRRDAHP